MKKILMIVLLYFLSLAFGTVFVYLYYKGEYGTDYGFNIRVFSFIGVPIIYSISSLLLDFFVFKNENNRIIRLAGFSSLPIFISSFFIAISFDSLRLFSEAIIFWYIVLFLLFLVISVFIYRFNDSVLGNAKLYMKMKYIFTLLLYIYGFFIWFGFGLTGMGV